MQAIVLALAICTRESMYALYSAFFISMAFARWAPCTSPLVFALNSAWKATFCFPLTEQLEQLEHLQSTVEMSRVTPPSSLVYEILSASVPSSNPSGQVSAGRVELPGFSFSETLLCI